VEALKGGHAERQGALMLLALVLLGGLSALLQWRGRAAALPLLRRRLAAGIGVVVVAAALAVALGIADHGPNAPARGATAKRLAQVGSNRYDYWKVALEAFGSEPLRGAGTSAFAVEWLRRRSLNESVRDAHSLYLETAAELGLAGLAALTLFLVGLAAAARRSYREDPALVTGWCAALAVFALHAGLDWDWEMPAVTLPALLLAAAIAGRLYGVAVSSAR
jgi:O-antigen ligase